MKAPRIPSFFKLQNTKLFTFQPRYYDKRKERREQLEKGEKANITLNRTYIKQNPKGRKIKILFLFIILSLLAYRFIIN